MTDIDVVWLVDLDPPSEVGGGRGFYPASARTDPPDETVMRARIGAVLACVAGEAGGKAAVTVHTSPRHRRSLLEGVYPELWRRLAETGAVLALHPHEERQDGSTFYDDARHMAAVIADTVALAAREGLSFGAFRSGTFAFNPRIPALLAEAGIGVDLSAAPALRDPARGIAWEAGSDRFDLFMSQGVPVAEIPIGWDGHGSDLGRNYLFNERMDLSALSDVWDAVRDRAAGTGHPAIVNFLCHGFGLVDAHWRRQAIAFLRHMERNGGRIISAEEAKGRLLAGAVT